MGVRNSWLLLYIPFHVNLIKLTYRAYTLFLEENSKTFAQPWEGIDKSTSLMSSSLVLQQLPTCLVCRIWIIFVIGGRWLYSCSFVGCCLKDMFITDRSILV